MKAAALKRTSNFAGEVSQLILFHPSVLNHLWNLWTLCVRDHQGRPWRISVPSIPNRANLVQPGLCQNSILAQDSIQDMYQVQQVMK